jgi:hypothetical protein
MKTFTETARNIPNIINPRNIYFFTDGSLIQFNRGSFDDYRVTYFPNNQNMNLGYSPKDEDYFSDLLELRTIVGHDIIWGDFMMLSDIVRDNGIRNNGSPDCSSPTIQHVRIQLNELVKKYPNDLQEETFKLFMTLWAVMISEWYHPVNDGPSILKHTLKIIGVYQVLNNIYNPEMAAKFSENTNMMNKVLLNYYPEMDLSIRKSEKLKLIMDLYQIDYYWLP